jgi:streptogramin lyase
MIYRNGSQVRSGSHFDAIGVPSSSSIPLDVTVGTVGQNPPSGSTWANALLAYPDPALPPAQWRSTVLVNQFNFNSALNPPYFSPHRPDAWASLNVEQTNWAGLASGNATNTLDPTFSHVVELRLNVSASLPIAVQGQYWATDIEFNSTTATSDFDGLAPGQWRIVNDDTEPSLGTASASASADATTKLTLTVTPPIATSSASMITLQARLTFDKSVSTIPNNQGHLAFTVDGQRLTGGAGVSQSSPPPSITAVPNQISLGAGLHTLSADYIPDAQDPDLVAVLGSSDTYGGPGGTYIVNAPTACPSCLNLSATEFGVGISPNSALNNLIAGPDGSLWFSELNGSRIGRITTSGSVTEFVNGITPGSRTRGITVGPDGNVWFTEYGAGKIGRISPAGQVTEFTDGISQGSGPYKIVTGPDGNLWFTEYNQDRIARITPSGVVTEFSSGMSAGARPSWLTVGPDGNLWFTEWGTNGVGRITTDGVITEFTRGISPGSNPNGIETGEDGNLWFTEYTGNRVGRITTNGQVTEYSTGISWGSVPRVITRGPDGAMWFTEYSGNRIGRIGYDGGINEYSVAGLSPNAGPAGITLGPDGRLWVATVNNSRIVAIDITTNDVQNIQTSIAAGTLIISTPYTPSSPLVLPAMTLDSSASEYATSAAFSNIQVTDTRPGNLPYTLSALATPLLKQGVAQPGLNETINAQNVGLNLSSLTSTNSTPNTFLGSQTQGTSTSGQNFTGFNNIAAAHVPGTNIGSSGLGGSTPHTVLHANNGLGTTVTNGTLTITAPTNTVDGIYAGYVTFSIIGS